MLSFALWDQLTHRLLHDGVRVGHWFIVIGQLFDMAHDSGHVVYVSRT